MQSIKDMVVTMLRTTQDEWAERAAESVKDDEHIQVQRATVKVVSLLTRLTEDVASGRINLYTVKQTKRVRRAMFGRDDKRYAKR
jgi:hypothetical protein